MASSSSPSAGPASPGPRGASSPGSPGSPPRSSVAISFGSPAAESGVTRLDLNDILVRHAQAAFLMRISGDSMREAGVHDGDLALVDRALDAAHGHVVIAIVGDEFVCRRLHRRGRDVRLQSADPACADWVPGENEELQIWGVVTHVVRPLGGGPSLSSAPPAPSTSSAPASRARTSGAPMPGRG